MNFKFGFELEGFFTNSSGDVCVPPKEYPTDDFPGLCEVSSTGGKSLEGAYFQVLNEYRKYPFSLMNDHKFSRADKDKIRARHSEKGGVNISNIYGKNQKLLGNNTQASFQINISKPMFTVNGVEYYGLFDFVPIVRALDEEFKSEIKDSGRLPGFYSVKDSKRLEYRSLPNSLFETDLLAITLLLLRIERCLSEKN